MPIIAWLALGMGVSAESFDPETASAATPEQIDSDRRVMGEIRDQIEAIPEATREIDGLEVLEKSIPRFALPAQRQRVLVSIGELSAKLGRLDEAIDAFERGLELAADPLLTLTCRTRLAEILAKSGRTKEAEAVLAAVAEPDSDLPGAASLPPDQTDDIYEAERKRIELLIEREELEEAFRRILRLAKAYPRHTREPLLLFEQITGPMFLVGDYANAIEWRRRAADALPRANDDPMFLSNAIVELQGAGRTDDAMNAKATEAMTAFVDRFPDHNSTPSFLKQLGVSSEMAGDLKAAKVYFERILASNLPPDDPQRRTARNDIARVTGRRIEPSPIDGGPPAAPGDRPSGRSWLLWLNALLVAVIAGWLFFRKLSTSSAP